MKPWQRNLLIVGIVCSILVLVFYSIFVVISDLAGILKFLLFLPAVGVLAGIVVAVCAVVYAIRHERTTLESGPGGAINIERSALRSTAQRAISDISGIEVQNISSRMVERKGDPVIDFKVTAVPVGTDSLMTCAGQIQRSINQAIEAFTGREVRYVGVDFVEPRRRREEDAAETVEEEPKEDEPSFFDRMKTTISERRSKHDEDILETEAEVEDVAVEPDDFVADFTVKIDEDTPTDEEVSVEDAEAADVSSDEDMSRPKEED